MYKFYVMEIQKSDDTHFAYLVHEASDEDRAVAQMKAESKYHQVLAAAAISSLPEHSAVLISSDGECLMSKYYLHAQEEQSEE